MRNPVRSEADAFHIAVGCAVLLAASSVLGAVVDVLVGVALFLGAVAGAILWELATKDPERRRPFREAASEAPARSGTTAPRVLVVANRTLEGEDLRAELRRRAAGGAELHIVVPIVCSRIHYIASDVDRELDEARGRLSSALAWARDEGFAATGTIGDPNAALDAIADELRLHGADEVIISTFPRGTSNWLETGIVERLRDELEMPVTHVVVEPDRASQPAARH
ncbi:MAG TPA: hypothetical protein VN213_20770 [Solirubrobacteraceae bacterium]|nr:hypothetical protein [Solirubrobacteraceae bacterium]